MFIYEKKYTEIWKENKKITESGMMKISAWDKRIKLDFFFDHLPFGEQIEGMCYLSYFLEKEFESTNSKNQMSWPVIFMHKQSHYTYQRPVKGAVAAIDNCYINLAGNVVICPIANKSRIDEQKQGDADENAGKEKSDIQYIHDLKKLLMMGEPYCDHYYNSFLLHGFYQYRHVVIGKGFLGVPGNFYEREAIAATMMGFAFFLEKENMPDLEASMLVKVSSTGMDNKRRKPEPGAYGYYLKRIPE